MQEWKEVKLFISSTFNDMHAERDYLVTEVYPELREWCEARRLRLTDIDLRWGVSEDHPETEDTVRTCLRCIDECRPFFLCFIGQRRGWVPDLQKYAAGEAEYEGLSAHLDQSSMTEIEIEHAALAPMIHILSGERLEGEKCHAIFFFRENPFSTSAGKGTSSILTEEQCRIYTNAWTENETEEDEKLEELRQRVRRDFPVYPYQCRWNQNTVTEELRSFGDACQGRLVDFSCAGIPLRETILSALKDAIEKAYPEHVPITEPDPYDEDALEQHLFGEMSAFDFIGREKELDEIRGYLENKSDAEGKAFLLYGEEGVGKTALLSKFWHDRQRKGEKMVFRSCGVTDAGTSEAELYLSIGNECGLFRGSEVSPSSPKYFSAGFFASMMEKGFDTLILDGAEHLTAGNGLGHMEKLPGGFRLILSTSRQADIDALKIPKTVMKLGEIPDRDKRIDLVKAFLKRSLKTLSEEQMDLIISGKCAGNPLYLKTVCSELMSYGSYAGLDDKIKRYGNTLDKAFGEVLDTVENECEENKQLFPSLSALLGFSRDGLDERELLEALKNLGYSGEEIRYRTNMILRRLRPYLSRANGRFDIPVYSLQKAIRLRYEKLEMPVRRALVGVYTDNLQSVPVSEPNSGVTEVHGSRELLYQYVMLKDAEGLHRVLQDESMMNLIPPGVYGSEYKNGEFYYYDKKTDLSYGAGSALLAEGILEKAVDCKNTIGSCYPHPYRSRCQKLREQENQTEFFRFRDLFYEMTQYAAASMRLLVCGIKSVRTRDDYLSIQSTYHKLTNGDGGVFSMMDYLSRFGADETGLSHQIEDMADSAILAWNDATKALQEMPSPGEKKEKVAPKLLSFTNLSCEKVDFHGGLVQYDESMASLKQDLFDGGIHAELVDIYAGDGCAVVLTDSDGNEILQETVFLRSGICEVTGSKMEISEDGTRFTFKIRNMAEFWISIYQAEWEIGE